MDTRLTPLPATPAPAARARAATPAVSADGSAEFGSVLREVTVRRGDTLVGLVKAHHRAEGRAVSERQAYLTALQVARDNGMADANRIEPGQSVRLDTASAAPSASRGSPVTPASVLPPGEASAAAPPAGTAVAATTASVLAGRASQPVFERTLARAVERGFVPPHEVDAVRERVNLMAQDYGFSPDDFARVALIESDGLNPAASNGRCHGIIQFCAGPGRGAASVGFGHNPAAIGAMSVLKQLDLVDRYFEDVGLHRLGGKVGLEDLYLSVLTPAARAQRHPDAPLPIAGTQARVLYEGNQRDAPITRRSIAAGLTRHAQERLAGSADPVAPLAQLVQGGSAWPLRRQ